MAAARWRTDEDGGLADLLDPLPVLAPAGRVQLADYVAAAGQSLVAFYQAAAHAGRPVLAVRRLLACHDPSPSGSVSYGNGGARSGAGAGAGRGRVPCSLVRTSLNPPLTRVQPRLATASGTSPTATTSPTDSSPEVQPCCGGIAKRSGCAAYRFCGEHVECTGERVGGLLVLVAFRGARCRVYGVGGVFVAERDLAGRDRLLGFDPGVEPVFQVGVLMGEDVALDACFGGEGDDGEAAAGAQRDLGGQRAGGLSAEPGGLGDERSDVLAGAGDVRACGVAPVQVRVGDGPGQRSPGVVVADV
jgi:hypothetical protein